MIPKRYENVDYQKDVPQNVKALFDDILNTQKGLYLYGGVGTGKTHIAYALLNECKRRRDEYRQKREEIGKRFEYEHYIKNENGFSTYFIDEEKEEAKKAAIEAIPLPLKEPVFWNVTEMLFQMRNSYGNEPEFIERLIDSPRFFFLDDIGAEKVTDWVEETLYLIVNKRYEKMMPMIFTSNLPLSGLAEKIGDRTVSRIKEMCHVVKLEGEDRRLKK